MTYLVLMPCTYKPYGDRCIATMAPEIRDHLLVVPNWGKNLGAAASYNLGAQDVLARRLDWLVTLSPSVRFGPPGGLDMIDYMHDEAADAWVVEAEMPVGWHWIAWHRRLFERIGLWDENYWPVYGEDADIAHRIAIAIAEDQPHNPWPVFECDAWMTMQGYSMHVAKVEVDHRPIWAYYVEKWGGLSGHELWDRPFGDPDLPLSYWEARRI